MSLKNGVLEASGLDFGGLGPPFWRVRASFSKALDVIFGTTNAKNAQKPAKTKAPSQGGQTAKGWVGGGDPPGGFQSAAHRRCGNGVLNQRSHRPQPKLQTYHKGPSSRWQAQVLCQALGPLSFSLPRSLGTTADPAPRSGKMGLCGFFFRFFALPSCNLNFASKKHRKKCENQGFWLPKPLPKRSQNPFKIDVPKNIGFFTNFCSIFAACCKSRRSKFVRPANVLLIFHALQLFAFKMHFG